MVNKGKEIKPAQKRGAIIRHKGFTAIISKLLNCEVARIKPNSAVNAEPARPANNNAVTTGPNSRTILSASNCPNSCSAPNFCNVLNPWSATTIPINMPDNKIIGNDKMPTRYNCVDNNGHACDHFGRRNNVLNKNKPERPMRTQNPTPLLPSRATFEIIRAIPLDNALRENEMVLGHPLILARIAALP